MLKPSFITGIFFVLLVICSLEAWAQPTMPRRIPRPSSSGGGKDSIGHRTGFEDSITIRFRYLDSSKMQTFDSSIYDFTKRLPIPWYHYHLGNLGNATNSMIFTPRLNSGLDPGFHAYDVYTYKDYETKFYNTTRPYSELIYQLGSRLEQVIGLSQTQNILPNWNAAFSYRLINSAGVYQNQNTNHNNYRFSSWYQSPNKRYQNFLILLGNKLESGENGGIGTEEDYLATVSQRGSIPTQLGLNTGGNRNFLSSDIRTGAKYTDATYLMRQQYDLIGDKDSIVTDSSVIPLFYARLRAEHTISYKTVKYRFSDMDAYVDSIYYATKYNMIGMGVPNTTYIIQDLWTDLTNDFSLYQFPEAKNSQQFIKAGAAFQMLTSSFDTGITKSNYHNFMVHGEYRNKTRNQKWDVEAVGMLYINGLNAGDYNAHISLRREISKKIGSLTLGFSNANRTPSFIYDTLSSFYLGDKNRNFKKENNTEIYGIIDLPRLKARITGRYTLLSNFSYFTQLKQAEQYPTVFNILQLTAEKQFRIGGNWNWRTWLVLQQPTGDPPLNLPVFLTRNQIGYDGNLGFKNLLISFGFEFRYYTPFRADAYSPLQGQFYYQSDSTAKLDFPETAFYLHFRIKSFTAYLRAENLNTYQKGGFTKNNIISPNYPYPGLQIRIGVYWSFVN